ncbi:MAG: CBS domain-containing protein [Rhodospirillales bacterium]
MNAADIMTPDVITARPDTPLEQLVDTMLTNRISGLPIVDNGIIVGIVSEGDLLRRTETGTQKRRSHLLELFASTASEAADYVRTHGRKASEIMTTDLVTVAPDTPIAEIADVLETKRIKRVPVVVAGKVLGIVTRANLLKALAMRLHAESGPVDSDDRSIRIRLLEEFRQHKWGSQVAQLDVTVRNGIVHLWGIVRGEDHRRALIVAAENTMGVKGVSDHLEDGTLIAVGMPGL